MEKLITTLLLLVSFCAFGDMYKYKSPDGRIFYSFSQEKRSDFKTHPERYTKIVSPRKKALNRKKQLSKKYYIGKTEKEMLKRRGVIAEKVVLLKRQLKDATIDYDRAVDIYHATGFIDKTKQNIMMFRIPAMKNELDKYETNYIANGGTKMILDSLY